MACKTCDCEPTKEEKVCMKKGKATMKRPKKIMEQAIRDSRNLGGSVKKRLSGLKQTALLRES